MACASRPPSPDYLAAFQRERTTVVSLVRLRDNTNASSKDKMWDSATVRRCKHNVHSNEALVARHKIANTS